MAKHSPRRDAKAEALRAAGALHPRPHAVRDPLFESHEFFDPRDLVQVRYEMLRRVDVDGQPVARTADTFGVSRPTFYQTQAAFTQQGFAGLVPRKRGPHGAHKLDDAVMAFVTALRAEDPTLSVRALLPRIHERFGLAVHPRSLERALKRREKKRP
jgi:transposase